MDDIFRSVAFWVAIGLAYVLFGSGIKWGEVLAKLKEWLPVLFANGKTAASAVIGLAKPLIRLAMFVAIAYGAYVNVIKHPDIPDVDVISVEYPSPSPELKLLTVKIQEYKGKPDAALWAKLHWDFADVLGVDSGRVKANSQLRSAYMTSQELASKATGVKGTLPGLNDALNGFFASALGKDDGPLDRPKGVAAFRAVAWALGGKN